jgi:PKD repeat protein
MIRKPAATSLAALLVGLSIAWMAARAPAWACDDFAINRAEMAYFVASGMAGGPESVPTGPASPSFPDVTRDGGWGWAYDCVEYLTANGVTTAYTDGLYHPGYEVDRAQMAVHLARALAGGDGNVPAGPATPHFADVPTNHWAYKYVEYAVSQDAVQGCDATHYCPQDAMLAYTAASWIEQRFGIALDPCAIPYSPLDAEFGASPQSGIAPLTVQFADSTSGRVSSWFWDFGDGTTSTEADPAHIYALIGRYTVSLTVANPAGSNTETKFEYIYAHAAPPVADFSAAPTSGPAPLLVQFTDLSYQGDPTSWLWDFGDGSTSTAQNPSHIYTNPGRYSVALTAVNDGGQSVRTEPRYILATFPDVPTDHWALNWILACVSAGIVQGYPDGTYGPDIPVTRDQMAVYVSRALAGGDEFVPSGPATPHFADVPTDYWAYDYVEYARYVGVVQGYSDGYHPTEPVDRGQMAVYIARAVADGEANVPDGPVIATFDDVPTDYWAYKYVEYCKAHGIVQGYDPVTYAPEAEVTRDQMAVYIARAFGLVM